MSIKQMNCKKHNLNYDDGLDDCPVCFGEEIIESEELCKKYSVKYTGKKKIKRIIAIKPKIKGIKL